MTKKSGLPKARGAEAKFLALLARPNRGELLERLLLRDPKLVEILAAGFQKELKSLKRSRKVRGKLEVDLDFVLRGSRPLPVPALVES